MEQKSELNNIQKLREATGAGVMECKKALEEAKGDFAAATKIINERGLAQYAKRAGRETGAGLIESYIHHGRIGVLLDIRAETDFVVNSDPFRALAHEIAMHIAAAAPDSVETLLQQPYIRDESKPVENLVKEVVARVGENIKVNAFYRLEL
ncbi:MAG: translation elongation factor Ts [Patescibacteria group bacterium]